MKEVRLLNKLGARERARVLNVGGTGALKKKLLDMGIVPGSMVEVLRVAPFGDPVEIRIRGYNLSLRKEEAGKVSVEGC